MSGRASVRPSTRWNIDARPLPSFQPMLAIPGADYPAIGGIQHAAHDAC